MESDIFVEEKSKCGEIFVTQTGHISCYCLMCEQDYEDFLAFSNHLLEDHLKSKHHNNVDAMINQNFSSTFTNNDSPNFVHVNSDNIKIEHSKSSISNKFKTKEANFISNFDCPNEDNENQYVTSSANSLDSQKTNTEFNIEITNDVKKYICKICQQHFTKTEIFKNKKINYSLDRNDCLYCQKCIQEFPTFKENKIKYRTERQAHQPKNDVNLHLINYGEIKSKEREKKLKTKNDFKFYSLIKDKNRTVKGINYCEICSKNFISQKEYDEHMLSFHRKIIAEKVIIIKPNNVRICPKKFEKIKQDKEYCKKVEACDFCGKLFATKNSKYQQHLRCHTGEKPFVCSICLNTFSSRGNLNYHISTSHSEERPYICTWTNCGKGFKIDRLRVLHERIHTGEKPYQCEQCGEHFAFQHKLSLHKKRKHLDKKDRPHKCDLCDKAFVLPRQLREHKYTHTGEKPNQCDICPAKFAKRTVLVEHKKLHTGEKKHVCGICGKAFAQRAGYSSHIKSHNFI